MIYYCIIRKRRGSS